MDRAASKSYAECVGSAGLSVVREFFERLHTANIVYCHWKSNEHLSAAIEGLTDLDVLVDRRRDSDLQRILAECGFKRFVPPPLRGYPGIDDYIALDPSSGRLVHLHLHFQLTLGERHLKSYRLPWDAMMLATRRFDPEHGVYIAEPTLELLLLVVRTAMKLRKRDRVRWWSSTGDVDFLRELAWLHNQVDTDHLLATAEQLLGPGARDPLQQLLQEPSRTTRLARFLAAVKPSLRRHRTYGSCGAVLRAWLREFQWIVDAVNRRHLHRATPLRRVSPRGGTVIAILGSDGSGKSTLARTLVTWLQVKLDVVPIYFGSGDGPGALYRLPMKLAYRMLRPLFKPAGEGQCSRPAASRNDYRGRLRAAARVPWALALSFEKRGKLSRMVRARNRGMIVVCDRFPQSEFPGFNDGPLLGAWHAHSWPLCRALANWEAVPYLEARLEPPDVVIKLNVTPETAKSRRPEMSLAELHRRVSSVHDLRFPNSRVVEISSEAALEAIALKAKEIVWEQL